MCTTDITIGSDMFLLKYKHLKTYSQAIFDKYYKQYKVKVRNPNPTVTRVNPNLRYDAACVFEFIHDELTKRFNQMDNRGKKVKMQHSYILFDSAFLELYMAFIPKPVHHEMMILMNGDMREYFELDWVNITTPCYHIFDLLSCLLNSTEYNKRIFSYTLTY